MQTEKEIREEIEIVRKQLNEKIKSSCTRIPDAEMMELSKKMDTLLNLLQKETVFQ